MKEFFSRFQGRQNLLDYAAQTGIPVTSTKAKPYRYSAPSDLRLQQRKSNERQYG
jgi:hypothetical protein